jgi:hypothetical protein
MAKLERAVGSGGLVEDERVRLELLLAQLLVLKGRLRAATSHNPA